MMPLKKQDPRPMPPLPTLNGDSKEKYTTDFGITFFGGLHGIRIFL